MSQEFNRAILVMLFAPYAVFTVVGPSCCGIASARPSTAGTPAGGARYASLRARGYSL